MQPVETTIDLACTGLPPEYPETLPELAGYLDQLPDLLEAFAAGLHGLAEWMDDEGIAGETGDFLSDTATAVETAKDAAGAALLAFGDVSGFWLAGAQPEPDSSVQELESAFRAGFTPENGDELAQFIERLPELIRIVETWFGETAEWIGKHGSGGIAEHLEAANMSLNAAGESADAAWGKFEEENRFWLAR